MHVELKKKKKIEMAYNNRLYSDFFLFVRFVSIRMTFNLNNLFEQNHST